MLKHKQNKRKPNPETPEAKRIRQQQWAINRKHTIRDYLYTLGKVKFESEKGYK